MKKKILLSVMFLGIITLSACSSTKNSDEKTQKHSVTSSSTQKSLSRSKSTSSSRNNATAGSQTEKSSTGNISKSSTFPLSGYSSEQIEYARVTETLLNYYKIQHRPVSIEVTKNGTNHPVFPFSGSVVVPRDTVTLSFSYDNTMAGTSTVTYSSNHNGTINFYKDPNHYQDVRYLQDPAWVKQESQKLLDSTQLIEIPTSFDKQASQIISEIVIK